MATLPAAEAALFIRLQVALLVYANERLGLVPGVDSEEALWAISLEDKLKIRDGLYTNPQVIDAFVAENPALMPSNELALVTSWKQAVFGTFHVFRTLKRYTVFLDDKEPPKAYGVLGITQEIEDLFPMRPPIMVQAVLLPWQDRIVHDGLVYAYSIYFGAGIRGSLNQAYQRIKATTGIIETLGGQGTEQTVDRRAKKRGPSAAEILATLDRIEQETARLRTPESPGQRSALRVLRAAVELARATVHEQVDVDEVVRAGRRLDNALNRLYTALDLG